MDISARRHASVLAVRLSLLLVFLLTQELCYAQNIKFGLRSGVGFSNFYAHQLAEPIFDLKTVSENPPDGKLTPIDPNTPYRPVPYYKTSLIRDMGAGIFSYFYMDYKLEPRLSAQIAVGYSQKGISMAFGLQNTTTNSDQSTVTLDYQIHRNLRLDYITVPLTVQYQLDVRERFYVVGGTYHSLAVNFLIKDASLSKNTLTRWPSGAVVASTLERETGIAYANRFDTGLLVGLGMELPLSDRLDIGVDLRGSLGLLNVPKAFEHYGFLGFSKSAKNLGLETGLKLQYHLH